MKKPAQGEPETKKPPQAVASTMGACARRACPPEFHTFFEGFASERRTSQYVELTQIPHADELNPFALLVERAHSELLEKIAHPKQCINYASNFLRHQPTWLPFVDIVRGEHRGRQLTAYVMPLFAFKIPLFIPKGYIMYAALLRSAPIEPEPSQRSFNRPTNLRRRTAATLIIASLVLNEFSYAGITGTPGTPSSNRADSIGQSGPKVLGQILDSVGGYIENRRTDERMNKEAASALKDAPPGSVLVIDKETVQHSGNTAAKDSVLQPKWHETSVSGRGKNAPAAAKNRETKNATKQELWRFGVEVTNREPVYYEKASNGKVQRVAMSSIERNQLTAAARDEIAREKAAEQKHAEAQRQRAEAQAAAEKAQADARAQAEAQAQAAARAQADAQARNKMDRERGVVEHSRPDKSDFNRAERMERFDRLRGRQVA